LQSKHRKISAVIFDIDGTLVDSLSDYYSVFSRGIGRYKLEPVSEEVLFDYLRKGLSLGEILRKIFPPHTEESIIEACKREIIELFLRIEVDEIKPFPGIEELFRNLKDRGLKIGIATGRMTSSEDEWKRFGRFGVERFIEAIVTSKEVEARKPAPDSIIECAKRLHVSPDECLVVGDAESDIVAARRAGARPVAVSKREDDREWLKVSKPEFVISDVKEIPVLLDRQEMAERGM
jgi:phosphoglycolate phosphatase